MLTFGTLLLSLTFVVLGLTNLNLWVSTVMMGISWSLVPAVIWPATTLIVEPHRLGTALGLITLIQALGMAASNLAAGRLADIIVLNKDPIADITVLQGGKHLSWVIKDGKIVDLDPRDDLLTFQQAAE